MKIFKRRLDVLKSIINKFIIDIKIFGWRIAIRNFFGSYDFEPFLPIKIGTYLKKKKFYSNINFLREKYSPLLDGYRNKQIVNKNEGGEKYIRVLWWQGLDNASDLVKICVKSIKENKGTYKVVFLDEKNYTEYVKLPNFILKKVEEGKISITHLSELIRMYLLKEYGGIWIDSTILVKNNIFDAFDYSILNSNCYDSNVWKFQKRCGYFIGGKPNRLFNFVFDFLISYYKDYDYLIDYLIMDYAIYIGYITFDDCKRIIDGISIHNDNVRTLFKNLNSPYDKKLWEKLNNISFSKLSRKVPYERNNKKGKTIYGKLLELNGY